MGKNGLCESDCNIFQGAISPEQFDEHDFLYVETNLQKVKVNWKFFRVGMVKNVCGLCGHTSLKFSVSQG